MDADTISQSVYAIIALALLGFFWKATEWKGGKDAESKDFKEFMKEVRDNIREILARTPPVATAGRSPIQLTDLGENIVKTLQPDNWVIRAKRNQNRS